MKDNIKIEYNYEKVRLYTIDPLGLIVIVNAPHLLISMTRFDFVKLLVLNKTSFGNRRTVAGVRIEHLIIIPLKLIKHGNNCSYSEERDVEQRRVGWQAAPDLGQEVERLQAQG